jgi:phospholipid transport system substrate-binding protein
MDTARIGCRVAAPARLAPALALSLALLMPMLRSAAAPDPNAIVGFVGAQGMAAVVRGVPAGTRNARLRRLFRDYFDVAGLAEFALGRYRWSASASQQQEFFGLYEEYTIRSYGAQLAQYGSTPFRIVSTRRYGEAAVVSSQIARPGVAPVRIDWYLGMRGGQYRVTDLVIAGISMRAMQRHEFGRWIEINGGHFGALLAVLRQQIEQLE